MLSFRRWLFDSWLFDSCSDFACSPQLQYGLLIHAINVFLSGHAFSTGGRWICISCFLASPFRCKVCPTASLGRSRLVWPREGQSPPSHRKTCFPGRSVHCTTRSGSFPQSTCRATPAVPVIGLSVPSAHSSGCTWLPGRVKMSKALHQNGLKTQTKANLGNGPLHRLTHSIESFAPDGTCRV